MLFIVFLLFFPARIWAQRTGDIAVPSGSMDLGVLPPVSAGVPELLSGIWENSSRLIQFTSSGEGISPFIVLKPFYGWYYDAVAVPQNMKPEKTYRNNTSSDQYVPVRTVFTERFISSSSECGIWDMRMYLAGGRQIAVIPAAVISDGLYLDFLLKGSAYASDEKQADEENISGFWRCGGNTGRIPAGSPVQTDKEVFSYYVLSEDEAYRIRYWRTDADYEQIQAVFSNGMQDMFVDKFLQIGDCIYTCVPGKGTALRNAERLNEELRFTVISDDGYAASLSQPYLKRSSAGQDINNLIDSANSRKKIFQGAPLPDPQLDFHYDVIEDLRKYTPNFDENRTGYSG